MSLIQDLTTELGLAQEVLGDIVAGFRDLLQLNAKSPEELAELQEDLAASENRLGLVDMCLNSCLALSGDGYPAALPLSSEQAVLDSLAEKVALMKLALSQVMPLNIGADSGALSIAQQPMAAAKRKR